VAAGSDLLRDLRLDSLSLMTLVVGLEDRYHVTLSEEDSEGVRTVGELAALVARKAAA
jgi:acyl carrier protein